MMTADAALSQFDLSIMRDYVEEQLDDVASGYQFAVAQDGEIIFEHSYTNPDAEGSPTITNATRFNLGSTTKLITVITMLKMIDDPNYDVRLDDPFVMHLSERFDEYKDQIHDDVKNVTILDLLTHTTGFVSGTRPTAGGVHSNGMGLFTQARNAKDSDNGDRLFCPNPNQIDPLDPLTGPQKQGCGYKYNNNNIGTLRLVIEGLTGTDSYTDSSNDVVHTKEGYWFHEEDEKHTQDYEDFIMDYWLADAISDANRDSSEPLPTCRATPEVHYFKRENGNLTREERAWGEDDQDLSCVSGGLKISSRDMFRVMDAVQNGSVLSDEMNSLLFGTYHESYYGELLGVGFQRPWSSYRLLGHNGDQGSAESYYTQLPGNAHAVLMVNSDLDPHGLSPTSILQAAYGETKNHVPTATATGDFDNDGIMDIVRGSPYQDVNGQRRAGAVDVVYGRFMEFGSFAGGVQGPEPETQHWTQDSYRIANQAEPNDLFGSALATGDFNGDGYDDLAIGVPGEGVGSRLNAGAVNVLFGSQYGLTANSNKLLYQGSISGLAEAGDRFGEALATGDFNNDRRADLVIGVPGEDLGSIKDAGAVQVVNGSSTTGLRSTSLILSQQNLAGSPAEPGDLFGSAFAVGNFDNRYGQDLAIGVPGEDAFSIRDAGAVNVAFSNRYGLSTSNAEFWHQASVFSSRGFSGGALEGGDRFGASLAAGNFDGAYGDDLAIGVPGEDYGSMINAGTVNVLHSSPYTSVVGLVISYNGVTTWHQGNTGGMIETGDHFGYSLVSADFSGDGRDDLAIGSPGEDVGTIANAGAVTVLYSQNVGLSTYQSQIWHQDVAWVDSDAEEYEAFGSSLAAGFLSFEHTTADSLLVGVTESGTPDVHIIYNNPVSDRLSATGDELFSSYLDVDLDRFSFG